MPRATPLAARNDTPKVGARVRSLRRERGLTIEQLAAATRPAKGFTSPPERERGAAPPPRRERGLTIEQLAAATGLTKGFISQLERDRTAPSLSSIARICDALGVRLGTIFEHGPDPALVRKQDRPLIDGQPSTRNHLLSL